MDLTNWRTALAAAASGCVFTVWVLVTGCAYMEGQGVQVAAPNPFEPEPTCTIYKDMGIDPATSTGVIPKYIKNPCAAQNIVVSVARSGAALEAYQIEHVRTFVAEAKKYMVVGLTFQNAKLFVGMQIGKLNREFGLLYFAVSDLLLVLPDTAILQTDDVTLVHASLDNMLAKVEEIAALLGYVPAALLRAELAKMGTAL
jgi:hypothetical protein